MRHVVLDVLIVVVFFGVVVGVPLALRSAAEKRDRITDLEFRLDFEREIADRLGRERDAAIRERDILIKAGRLWCTP
jgi:hypothetical protein